VHVEAQLHQGIARQLEKPGVRYHRNNGPVTFFGRRIYTWTQLKIYPLHFGCAVINAGESGYAQDRSAAVRAGTRRKIAAGRRWEPGSLGENFCGMQGSRILDSFRDQYVFTGANLPP